MVISRGEPAPRDGPPVASVRREPEPTREEAIVVLWDKLEDPVDLARGRATARRDEVDHEEREGVAK